MDFGSGASELGLSRFAVLAYSAGAPYALACASCLPKRIVLTTLLAGLGPLEGVEARRSLPRWVRVVYGACHRAHWLAVPLFGLFAQRIRHSPERLFPRWFLMSLAPSDRTVLAWFLPEEGHFSLPVGHQHAILGEIKHSVG